MLQRNERNRPFSMLPDFLLPMASRIERIASMEEERRKILLERGRKLLEERKRKALAAGSQPLSAPENGSRFSSSVSSPTVPTTPIYANRDSAGLETISTPTSSPYELPKFQSPVANGIGTTSRPAIDAQPATAPVERTFTHDAASDINEVQRLNARVKQLTVERTELEGKLFKSDRIVADLNNKLKQLDSLVDKKRQLENELSMEKKKREYEESKTKDLESQLRDVQKELAGMRQQAENSENTNEQIELMESLISELNDDKDRLERKLQQNAEALQEAMDEKAHILSQVDARVENALEKANHVESEKDHLKKVITERDTKLQQLQSAISERDRQIAILVSEVEERDKSHESNRLILQEKSTTAGNLQRQLDEATQQSERYRGEAEAYKDKHEILVRRYQQVERTLQERNQQLQGMQARLSQAQENSVPQDAAAQLQARLDQALAENSNLRAENQEFTSILAEMEKGMAQLQSSLVAEANSNDRVAEVEESAQAERLRSELDECKKERDQFARSATESAALLESYLSEQEQLMSIQRREEEGKWSRNNEGGGGARSELEALQEKRIFELLEHNEALKRQLWKRPVLHIDKEGNLAEVVSNAREGPVHLNQVVEQLAKEVSQTKRLREEVVLLTNSIESGDLEPYMQFKVAHSESETSADDVIQQSMDLIRKHFEGPKSPLASNSASEEPLVCQNVRGQRREGIPSSASLPTVKSTDMLGTEKPQGSWWGRVPILGRFVS